MKRKILTLLALTAAMCLLSGCGIVNAVLTAIAPNGGVDKAMPHKLVQAIDISATPADGEFDRHYESQRNLTTLLRMLREMETRDYPEEQPDLDDGQSYYTVTATYSCGEEQVYWLLGYRYLKVGDGPWCIVEFERVMDFADYLKRHPSENGIYTPPETTPPPETTAPPETTVPATES